ncbi:preprotein translocase subunit SecE [Candidatus Phytoplasma luffae]|uniref:Preprotein translocase subunit SecE n=1 Tax=Loofah witches'-broom phytoplasma TaxID=35773 RepID=A0A975IM87_LOWBP|nr:hypothetical protein [Candidatus Phytoplasma luffae]QTX02854.1 preprotein translocase subunit SecE [Candidatus Phytoplasma luffae]
MVVQNKSKKNDFIPLLEIIKEKYGLLNIFLIIFSIFFIGIFRTMANYLPEEKKLSHLIWLGIFVNSIIFIIGILPFCNIIKKDLFSINWPSFKEIIIQLIKIIIFVIVLVNLVHYFEFFYSNFL